MSIVHAPRLRSQKQTIVSFIIIMQFLFAARDFLYGQSLDIPVKGYGISF